MMMMMVTHTHEMDATTVDIFFYVPLFLWCNDKTPTVIDWQTVIAPHRNPKPRRPTPRGHSRPRTPPRGVPILKPQTLSRPNLHRPQKDQLSRSGGSRIPRPGPSDVIIRCWRLAPIHFSRGSSGTTLKHRRPPSLLRPSRSQTVSFPLKVFPSRVPSCDSLMRRLSCVLVGDIVFIKQLDLLSAEYYIAYSQPFPTTSLRRGSAAVLSAAFVCSLIKGR